MLFAKWWPITLYLDRILTSRFMIIHHLWFPRTRNFDRFLYAHEGQCKLTRDPATNSAIQTWMPEANFLVAYLLLSTYCSHSMRMFGLDAHLDTEILCMP